MEVPGEQPLAVQAASHFFTLWSHESPCQSLRFCSHNKIHFKWLKNIQTNEQDFPSIRSNALYICRCRRKWRTRCQKNKGKKYFFEIKVIINVCGCQQRSSIGGQLSKLDGFQAGTSTARHIKINAVLILLSGFFLPILLSGFFPCSL